MGNSTRRTSIAGFADSDKKGKRRANRSLRHKVRVVMRGNADDELVPLVKECGDAWHMPKAPKGWFNAKVSPKLLRK